MGDATDDETASGAQDETALYDGVTDAELDAIIDAHRDPWADDSEREEDIDAAWDRWADVGRVGA